MAEAWEDEQITVFDCQERLSRFKYIALTDVDEFFVPYKDTTLPYLFVSDNPRDY